jgi:hypothetical protein
MGNPIEAPAVFRNYWMLGGTARVGVMLWLSGIPVGIAIGILFGIDGNHTVAHRQVFGWIAAGLCGLAFCLVVLGGILVYRRMKRLPRE